MEYIYILFALLIMSFLVFIGVTGLKDPTQSLGLPKGSVRALLAIFVITAFVAMIVSITEAAIKPIEVEYLNNVSNARFSKLASDKSLTILNEIPNERGGYSEVALLRHTSSSIIEHLEMLIGALVALVSSLSGYYFGNRGEQTSLVESSKLAITEQGAQSDLDQLSQQSQRLEVIAAKITDAQSIDEATRNLWLNKIAEARKALANNDLDTYVSIVEELEKEWSQ